MSHEVKWIAKGQIYKEQTPVNNPPYPKDDIPIPESEEDGLHMPGGKNIFGEPVDARLAVFYIRKLWKKVLGSNVLTIAEDTKALFDELKSMFEEEEAKSIDKDALNKKLDQVLKTVEEANNWLISLLDNSFGITLDKNTLLKTLSQPGCEGMRFYLALKDKPDKRKQASENDGTSVPLPVILTLVSVGVNQKAEDLHFEFYPEKQDFNNIPHIDNSSLCTEYPRTPLLVGKKGPYPSAELDPYVLYRYSMFKDPDQYK